MQSRKSGASLILISAVLWGMGGIAGQLVYEGSDITTPFLIEIRMLFSGIILTVIALKSDGKKIFNIFKVKNELSIFLFYSIMGNFLVQYSYFEAVQYSNGATATLLQYISPTMVMLIIAVNKRQAPDKIQIICVFLALLGLFLISTHGSVSSLSISYEALLWGLISAAALSINNIAPVCLLKKYGSCAVVGLAMLTGALITQLIFNPFAQSYEISPKIWGIIMFILIFSTTIPFAAFLYGIKIVGSTTGSILSNIEPLTASLVSILFLNAKVTGFDLTGFCLIIGVAVVLTLCDNAKNRLQKIT